MVNFADAVTKVSYGKLQTVTPNAKGVQNFLHNVSLTNTKPFGGTHSILAENAMYSMGAGGPALKEFAERFGQLEPHGLMQNDIVSIGHNPICIVPKNVDIFIKN